MTLCHATGSASNPYVRITVAAAGAFNGHYSQHEDLGQGDIIPPFMFQGQTYSLNWNSTGQNVFNKGCQTTDGGGGGGGNGGGGEEKVTLCHATGSSTNPYVRITVAAAGAFNGHYSQHEDLGGGDIIPPFTYKGSTYSLNWTSAGQSVFDKGCQTSNGGGNGGGGGGNNGGDGGNNNGNVNGRGDNGGKGKAGKPVGGQNLAARASDSATPTTTSAGPIPGAADAGQGMADGWQLAAGLVLAGLGALGAGTAVYRRRFLGR